MSLRREVALIALAGVAYCAYMVSLDQARAGLISGGVLTVLFVGATLVRHRRLEP